MNPLHANCDPNLLVCSASGTDIDNLVRFHHEVFRPSVGVWSKLFLSGLRPGTSVEHFLYVKDIKTDSIVSSLCFLFQKWRYADVFINVGQIELVGTAPIWRRQGLIRMQMPMFDDLLHAHQCVLACVQGIPGIYQRFGYEYAVPLKGGVHLLISQIPSPPVPCSYSLRLCELRDIPLLCGMYNAGMESLSLSSVRDESLWFYQESQPVESEHAYETYVLERGGIIIGYFRMPRHSTSAVVIRELNVDCYEALLFVFDFARCRALQMGLGAIRLQLPMTHPAIQASRYLGAQEITPFAWQVRVVDWPAFLKQISPVLECRLRVSLLAKWTGRLCIHLIDQGTLRITVEKGRFSEFDFSDHIEAWDVESPSGLFCQLVLGYRNSQALMTWHPDFQVRLEARFLVDVLFPQCSSFVYEAY